MLTEGCIYGAQRVFCDGLGTRLRDDAIEEGLHIYPHVRVCVFVDGERGGCVLDEDVRQAASHAF